MGRRLAYSPTLKLRAAEPRSLFDRLDGPAGRAPALAMRRREFIGLVGAAAAWPIPAAAQAPERIVTIGYLGLTDARQWTEGHGRDFEEGLRELGYIEGKNLRFVFRYAEGDEARLSALASELAAHKVDVIVTYAAAYLPRGRRRRRPLSSRP